MEKNPSQSREIKSLDKQNKSIIEFLILNYYTSPISLSVLQTADTKLLLSIADFILKSIDSSLSCTTIHDLIETLKILSIKKK